MGAGPAAGLIRGIGQLRGLLGSALGAGEDKGSGNGGKVATSAPVSTEPPLPLPWTTQQPQLAAGTQPPQLPSTVPPQLAAGTQPPQLPSTVPLQLAASTQPPQLPSTVPPQLAASTQPPQLPSTQPPSTQAPTQGPGARVQRLSMEDGFESEYCNSTVQSVTCVCNGEGQLVAV